MGLWFNGTDNDHYINQVRGLEEILKPYVSSKPRRAYLNCVDLDFGTNDANGGTSYSKAKKWGSRYFHRNFRRLAIVKGKADPTNFFFNEQSIPPLLSLSVFEN
ncbi:OLC1v1003284C1 [Oldenlandia corymbosa var. corymbosa]|uniref:OLC1v1003284C1 n=1 Tax=Oldenlandia corymbosa var. corymbosa TaxID=529605 RepID=A0AAV1DC22_OLDCO|nr:OLC1v1003284C1 [Oldenlandia corymbosa var. corymbosa]